MEEKGKMELLDIIKTLEQENKKLKEENNKLKQQCALDSLTKIPNRRCFDQRLEAEWRRAKRKSESITMIMIDIDFFKRYNDAYGHQEGDECLRKVARTLSSALRRSGDFIARYGGEEFAVLLPNTDENGATKVARKLCAKIENLAITHTDSVFGIVTVSLGIASVVPGQNCTEFAQLLSWADQALYDAKATGRNCFRVSVKEKIAQ